LKKMARDAFVAKYGPRIFYGSPNVEVLAARVVGWDEIESAVVLVIQPGSIHEPARAGRFERVGKLANIKWPQVFRQRYQALVLEELDHLTLALLVRAEKLGLGLGNVAAAPGVGIRELWIRKHCLERSVSGQLGFTQHRDLVRIKWQQIQVP